MRLFRYWLGVAQLLLGIALGVWACDLFIGAELTLEKILSAAKGDPNGKDGVIFVFSTMISLGLIAQGYFQMKIYSKQEQLLSTFTVPQEKLFSR